MSASETAASDPPASGTPPAVAPRAAPPAEPPLPSPFPVFLVGQDPEGRWLALRVGGRAGGLFRSRADALRYARSETGRRPGAVRLSAEPLTLLSSAQGSRPETPACAKVAMSR